MPEWEELERSLASFLDRSFWTQGPPRDRAGAEVWAARCMVWLEHSGLPLHDLCDGTLTAVLIEDPAILPACGC